MFRAHRGASSRAFTAHRGAPLASVRLHAAQARKRQRVRGAKYPGRTAPATTRQARYASLVKVPASYRQTRPAAYKSLVKVPASYHQKKPAPYKPARPS